MDFGNSPSLFSDDPPETAPPVEGVPLAERMRPRSLSEFVGQTHLVGEGRILRRLLAGGGALPSLILWGAPGTGWLACSPTAAASDSSLSPPSSQA